MNRPLILALFLVAAAAILLRLPHLGQRPFHADESVHAVKFVGLWRDGAYKYDPEEYHGPILYYATLPVAWLSGAETAADLREATLRLVPVLFGVGLILGLLLLSDGLGTTATLWAASFTAISPAFVFYSRYYIHEVPLVFFTLLLIGAGWRYRQTRALGWAILAGVALGGMHITKETFVFNLAALVGAFILLRIWNRVTLGNPVKPRFDLDWKHLAAAVGVAFAVSVVFFSSFFTNAAGPLDSVRTYGPWLDRAGGASPHVHPWFFYFERLLWFHQAKGPVWTEVGIYLLAAVGGGAALFGRTLPGIDVVLARFLTFYTLLLTAIYTVISYKTPWCVLGFHHGFILLAGLGVAVLFGLCRTALARGVLTGLLVGVEVHLAVLAWLATHAYATDQCNPYVYAHTSQDFSRLIRRIQDVAEHSPDPENLVIKVMAGGGDYWPLPWYLRGFQTGFWNEVPDGREAYAPMMIADSRLNADLDEKSNKDWLMTGFYELRPNEFLELYVEFPLWEKYVMSLPANRDEDDDEAEQEPE